MFILGWGTQNMKMCSNVNTRVGTFHMKMCSNVDTMVGTGTPDMKMCSDVNTKVGTMNIKMCKDDHIIVFKCSYLSGDSTHENAFRFSK